MKKVLIGSVFSFGLLFGFTPTPVQVQAVETSKISVEQAYERLGKRQGGRIGLSRYTRNNGSRNPGNEADRVGADRRSSAGIAPKKSSRKGIRRYSRGNATSEISAAESLADFYKRPRYARQ